MMRPRTENPREAAILDDATGEIIGGATRCDACLDYIDTMTDRARHGACASVNPYTWRCLKCIVEQRPTEARAVVKKDLMIPERYSSAAMTDLKPAERSIAKLWPSRKPFMVVYGSPGSGKTRLTWAYYRWAAQYGKIVTMVQAPAAHTAWKSKFDSTRYQWEQAWKHAAHLIMDDLSACDPDPRWAELIHNLIDFRTNHAPKLPMLITAAYGAETLGLNYGDAIHSRLKEFEPLTLAGIDHRARINAEAEKTEDVA